MTVLGLDIGGANLKAATPAGRAVSVPFALWKQPQRLPAAVAELIAAFPEAGELAVTMTGELCDCFETKRAGVAAILEAVEQAAAGRPVRVWSTGGEFVAPDTARARPWLVAAANWHALATVVAWDAPAGDGLLIDTGSTTTDVIPLRHGRPVPRGRTDSERLATRELVYFGARRTPICAVLSPADGVCAELFATTLDVGIVLGLEPQRPQDRDTADGRPATLPHALARLARMLGGDRETLDDAALTGFARQVWTRVVEVLAAAARTVSAAALGPGGPQTVVVAGSGEVLARAAAEAAFPHLGPAAIVSWAARWGPEVSACAPAYAVAVLAAGAGR